MSRMLADVVKNEDLSRVHPVTRRAVRAVLLAGLAVVVVSTACGKKGPPLPPLLILLPNAPADLSAVRRADHVELTFRVPKRRKHRPQQYGGASSRVEVYALTSNTRHDSRRCGGAWDACGNGGSRTNRRITDEPDQPRQRRKDLAQPERDRHHLRCVERRRSNRTASRASVAVRINKQEPSRSALRARLSVPLSVPPPAPSRPQITYDEKALAISWPVVDVDGSEPLAYVVYRPGEPAVVLTPTPLAEPSFTDTAIEWEKERCYEVRAVVGSGARTRRERRVPDRLRDAARYVRAGGSAGARRRRVRRCNQSNLDHQHGRQSGGLRGLACRGAGHRVDACDAGSNHGYRLQGYAPRRLARDVRRAGGDRAG
ncbi:MAG: hypothetical protein QM736_18900, partial [Vicinamibacterales bacterium]